MTAAPNSPLVERVTAAIRNAPKRRYVAHLAQNSTGVITHEKIEFVTDPELQAQAAIEACEAEALIACLRECADDLSAEVIDRYAYDGKIHPANAGRYARDMTPVMNARALLARLDGKP
jgi:hypothetical protein